MAWASNRGRTHLLGHAKRYIVTPDFQMLDHALAKQHGITGEYFQSGAEAKRWIERNAMQRAGHVRNLRRQVPFALHVVNPAGLKVKIGKWSADFVYEEQRPVGPNDAEWKLPHDDIPGYAWFEVVEDVKPSGGHREELYSWKRKHVEAEYGITVVEFAPRGR